MGEHDDAAIAEHLRYHLTDGAWHDRCRFCRNRRVHGGTGVPSAATLPRADRG